MGEEVRPVDHLSYLTDTEKQVFLAVKTGRVFANDVTRYRGQIWVVY